ncbi:hypothetical protein D915_011150 [Fasciola hepatica]|uniref:Uncharacterized protein n=1 Tax=Fasciola hepatica TaxID=6192 RepID=A0A4E0QUT1_FASHE|nr:hypothetical protein D915_011150 [Fasciola hepatica]
MDPNNKQLGKRRRRKRTRNAIQSVNPQEDLGVSNELKPSCIATSERIIFDEEGQVKSTIAMENQKQVCLLCSDCSR